MNFLSAVGKQRNVFSQGPPTQCAIVVKDNPLERISFESYPDSIEEGYNVNWNARDGTGRRSHALRVMYTGGTFENFSLNLIYVAGSHQPIVGNLDTISEEGLQFSLDNKIEQALVELEKKVRFLQALCFPKSDIPRSFEEAQTFTNLDPPRILVVLGSFLTIEGVLDSWRASWKPPFHPITARPFICEVSLSIKRLSTYFPDFNSIRDGTVVFVPQNVETTSNFVGPLPEGG